MNYDLEEILVGTKAVKTFNTIRMHNNMNISCDPAV